MKKLLTLLLLLCAFVGYSTNYYVRTDGNNANAGTTNSAGGAWLTLVYAAAHTTSGDVILVQAGTFNCTAQVVLPVGVSIQGLGVTSVITSTATAFLTSIIDLHSATVGTSGNQSISFLSFQGQSLATSMAFSITARSNVSVHDCTFNEFNFSLGWFSGNPNLFSNPGNEQEPTIYATGNTFYNNIVTNCAGYDNWGGSSYGSGQLWVTGQSGMTIHDNNMNQTQRANTVNGWLIKALNFTKGVKIYNNTLIRSPYPYTSQPVADYWNFAIEMGDEQGVEIYGNTISGSIDLNRQVKGVYDYSAYIHDNTISWASLGTGYENGLILEYSTETAIIERNTFGNVTEIIQFSTRNLSNITNITINNNLAYNIGQVGQVGNGHAIHFITDNSDNYTVTNFTANHNTFVGNASLQPFYGFSCSKAASVTNLVVTNNIFENFGASAIGANNGTVVHTCNASYNDFYQNFANIVWGVGNPTAPYTSTPNLTANPLFIGGGNYTLNPISTLVNAGSDGTDIGYTGGTDAPLTITLSSPLNGAAGILTTVHPTITFSEALNESTVNSTNIVVTQGVTVITGTWAVVGSVATFTPTSNLSYSLPYVITVSVNVLGISDAALNSPQTITFTTVSSPSNKIITQYLRAVRSTSQ